MPQPFFDRLSRIDDLLATKPQAATFARQIRPLLKEEEAVWYFYDHLDDPAWLTILEAEGEFSVTRGSETNEEGRTGRYAPWPQGKYLKRIAPVVPERVCAVLRKIPRSENPYVQKAVAQAACAMPAGMAATVADVIANQLSEVNHVRHPDDYVALINHLAEGGETQAALKIAETLLKPLANPKRASENSDRNEFSRSEQPTAKLDDWHYKDTLEKVLPTLAKTARMKALALFNGLLEDACNLIQRVGEDGKLYESYYLWPAAIENHEQNRHRDSPKDLLVFAVRDAGEALIEEFGKAVLESIEKHRLIIFKRISLHLRRVYPEVDFPGTDALLNDPGVYTNAAFHHELFHLLRTVFGKLSPATQEVFFKHGPCGFSLERFKKKVESWEEREPTEEEVKSAARRHEFNKLVPVKDCLTGEWADRWRELSQEFEISEHPDFLIYFGSVTRTRSISAVDQGELEEMSAPELSQFLRQYAESEDTQGSTLDGLGVQVGQLVKSDPEKYLPNAALFKGLPPEIIWRFLSSAQDLARDGKKFPPDGWAPTLFLSQWVVAQPRDEKRRKGEYAEFDPGWGWTRKGIGQLLEEGLKAKEATIPPELREMVWSVLRPLADDPDPTAEREEAASSSIDLSINTVRGWAMHAVVQYALWIRRTIDKQPDAEIEIARGFEAMPEVREVLDAHLDPETEPSRAIRAVYGQWFPWLFLLDKQWARAAKDRIFPKSEDALRFFEAAWGSYIVFCNPYNNLFPVLRDEYALAIQRIGTWPEEQSLLSNCDERLGFHLVSFYWHGIIGLDDLLIQGLYEKGSGKLRGYVLDFIGRSLEESKKESSVDEETLSRLRALWERRLAAGKQAGSSEERKAELSAFGSWFVSGAFEDEWALEQLEEVLFLTSWAEPDHRVVEHLAELSERFPRQTVNCLEMMVVEGQKEPWNIPAWGESIRKILSNALKHDDASNREAATDMVHKLGSMGYLEYRDLVPRQ